MRIAYIVDGRSPIALSWMEYFIGRGDEVHLISTYPCRPELELASLQILPVGMSEMAAPQAASTSLVTQAAAVDGPGKTGSGLKKGAHAQRVAQAVPVGLRTSIRQWLAPLTLPGAARQLRQMLEQIQPDLVHAMRIPYEGMLAAMAKPTAPWLVSVWGNDFTLHAPSTPLMRRYTRLALEIADALHVDCQRDLRLARAWGFPAGRPAVALPGNGGVRLEWFYPPAPETPQGYAVINPRGFRAYVNSEAFFRSIPHVLAKAPQARFLCPNMAGEARAQRWVVEFGISEQVDLLPGQSRAQMGELFRRSQVAVSPSTHDGTPNTLLEAMACGCFPVAGDIESLREWITPGVNGWLVDPEDPEALAVAIIASLENRVLREGAAKWNARLISERAEYQTCMAQAGEFYAEVLARSKPPKNP